MDNATATQRRWTVDGDRRQWMAQWQLNDNGLDGSGRCDGNWWTAMDGLTVMGRNGWLIHGDRRWMAMDCDGRCDGHSTAMDSTAMDGEGRLDGDQTWMDQVERHERDGDGLRAQL